MAVTTIILFQVFYLLNCRSLKDSILKIGLFTNNAVWVGIGALLVLQAAFVYAPPLQLLFGSAPLDGGELAKSALAGAVVLPVIVAEKVIRARLERRG